MTQKLVSHRRPWKCFLALRSAAMRDLVSPLAILNVLIVDYLLLSGDFAPQ